MRIIRKTLLRHLGRCSALLLAACAAQPPVPFELVDKNNVAYQGTFDPNNQSMQISIGKKTYSGFYITESGVANSTGFAIGIGSYGRYGGAFGTFPQDRYTTYSNNNARAHLKSEAGDQLTCGFVFESRRAIGECKSPQGEIYQLVANQARPDPAPTPAATP